MGIAAQFVHLGGLSDNVFNKLLKNVVDGVGVVTLLVQLPDYGLVMRDGDDFYGGINGFAEFFPGYFVDVAVGAFTYYGVDVPNPPQGFVLHDILHR